MDVCDIRFRSCIIAFLAVAAITLASCRKEPVSSGEETTEPEIPQKEGFSEPVPEIPVYTNASVVYYGTDQYNEDTDYWVLTLYTDMEVSGGWPVGPGQMISLEVNAPANLGSEPSLNYLAGEYRKPSNSMDFSEGTYIQGDMYSLDLPEGRVEMPTGCFFGDIAEGETDFEPDLLREGQFTISDNRDGTFTIDGILVGTKYLKRYFSYTGSFDPVDRSGAGNEGIPNSNLTADVLLTGLTQTRLIDRKDYFFLGDESYRLFLLYIAEETVDLSGDWPKGTGRLLRLELFVPWESDVADGIPAGTYTMCNRTQTGGIPREEIVPFRVVEGYPDKFDLNTGTWYQELSEGSWTGYGRITGGSVVVERPGGSHVLTIDLTDCGSPSRRVYGTIEF